MPSKTELRKEVADLRSRVIVPIAALSTPALLVEKKRLTTQLRRALKPRSEAAVAAADARERLAAERAAKKAAAAKEKADKAADKKAAAAAKKAEKVKAAAQKVKAKAMKGIAKIKAAEKNLKALAKKAGRPAPPSRVAEVKELMAGVRAARKPRVAKAAVAAAAPQFNRMDLLEMRNDAGAPAPVKRKLRLAPKV